VHARIVTIKLRPGTVGKAIELYRDSVLPAARDQHGFKDAMLLTDLNTDEAVSITLWETEADLLASETSGYYQTQLDIFAGVGIFSGPPQRAMYEVSVQA
jgi:heme-degrading monooxygenase HmoA